MSRRSRWPIAYNKRKWLSSETLATTPERSPLRADAWQVLATYAAEVETPATAEAFPAGKCQAKEAV